LEVLELREILDSRASTRRELPPPEVCRAWRRAAGATLAEVAAPVGVTPSAVGLWERGLRRPTGDHLRRYVAVLRVLRDDVLDDREPAEVQFVDGGS
jgi:transcriptional regulator with XRE-family HTH domain